MNRINRKKGWKLIVCFSVLVAVFGSGASANSEERGHADEDGHGHEEEESAGAEFTEGKGLIVHEEARKVIDLRTTEVTEEQLAMNFSAVAQIFKIKSMAGGATKKVLASAMISSSVAETLKIGKSIKVYVPGSDKPLKGRLVRLDGGTREAIDRVEAIVEVLLKDVQVRFGTFLKVEFAGKNRDVYAMPRSALLKAATGNFAYVKNGSRFLRTEVEVGASSDEMIEVLGGVYPGDVVVSKGVEDLWLIELRFTKGGGHSH